MERINPNSPSNPLYRITRDELLRWIYDLLEAQGHPRLVNSVQINVEHPFGGSRCPQCGFEGKHCPSCGSRLEERHYHHEVPELIVMISNLHKAN